jgi:hypothetical protein
MERHGPGTTHDVTNQVPPLADYNLFTSDTVLTAALERDSAAWHHDALQRHGAALTTPDTLALAELANRHTRSYTPTVRAASASTRWNFTLRGTRCCHYCGVKDCTRCRFPIRNAAPWRRVAPAISCMRRSSRARCAR